MIYLLHGDDKASSRKFLSELTNGFTVNFLDGKGVSVSDLEIAISSQSLFDEKKAVVTENLFLKNKKRKELVSFLKNSKTDTLLIFWEDGKVAKTSFSLFKELTVREFSYPSNYFLFLDTFAPKNAKKAYMLFEELVGAKGAELVFYSLLKRIRLLLMLESKAFEARDIANLAPWQLSRLQKQLNFWPKENLFRFYSQLQETEINLKSGKLPVSLSKHLDILILSEL